MPKPQESADASAQDIEQRDGIIPAVMRGEDQRGDIRPGHMDWRVNPRSYNFVGAVFDPLTPLQTLSRAKWMTTQHSFRYIVTPNVDHIVRLWKEPEVFAPLYETSWLSVCDSRILELLAKFSGVPLHAVPGSDLTAQLFDNVIKKDEAITVIGADADIIAGIRKRYGIRTIHHHEPPMGMRKKPEAVAAAAQFVADHPARYVFICVGSPQQEMVAKACLERGDCVGLGLCVGASLEFITGRVQRAPKWMQEKRLEWLHRLMSEPGRLWKRYLVEGPKIFLIWLRWSATKKGPMRLPE